jgi:hypothetical protein
VQLRREAAPARNNLLINTYNNKLPPHRSGATTINLEHFAFFFHHCHNYHNNKSLSISESPLLLASAPRNGANIVPQDLQQQAF